MKRKIAKCRQYSNQFIWKFGYLKAAMHIKFLDYSGFGEAMQSLKHAVSLCRILTCGLHSL